MRGFRGVLAVVAVLLVVGVAIARLLAGVGGRSAATQLPSGESETVAAIQAEVERMVRHGPISEPVVIPSSALAAIEERWAPPDDPPAVEKFIPRMHHLVGLEPRVPLSRGSREMTDKARLRATASDALPGSRQE